MSACRAPTNQIRIDQSERRKRVLFRGKLSIYTGCSGVEDGNTQARKLRYTREIWNTDFESSEDFRNRASKDTLGGSEATVNSGQGHT